MCGMPKHACFMVSGASERSKHVRFIKLIYYVVTNTFNKIKNPLD